MATKNTKRHKKRTEQVAAWESQMRGVLVVSSFFLRLLVFFVAIYTLSPRHG
jgi:hypothetical protein